jgi:hypothetical protein
MVLWEQVTVIAKGETHTLFVSDTGEIRNASKKNPEKKSKKVKHITRDSNRYQIITVKGKHFYVHRLVAEAFIPLEDGLKGPDGSVILNESIDRGKLVVHHKDHNTENNRVDNLAYLTKSANSKDKELFREHNITHRRDVAMANRSQPVHSYEDMPDDLDYYEDDSLAYSPSQNKWYGARYRVVGKGVTGWMELKEWDDKNPEKSDKWHYWAIRNKKDELVSAWFRQKVLIKSNGGKSDEYSESEYDEYE